MSTTATYEQYSTESHDDDESLEYRALHSGAIIGLVLGLASIAVVLTAANSFEYCLTVVPIPLVGIFVSLRAWAQIARQRDQYTGTPLAIAGLALSTLFLISGVSYGGYVYTTEVPEGYARISFATMKPDAIDERGGKVITDGMKALEGKKVFIKGYFRPDSSTVRKNAKRFLLVRDNKQCCFGDMMKVKYYDQMFVEMQGSKSVDYSDGVFRMGGTLRLHPENLILGPGAPVFSLAADYAK